MNSRQYSNTVDYLEDQLHRENKLTGPFQIALKMLDGKVRRGYPTVRGDRSTDLVVLYRTASLAAVDPNDYESIPSGNIVSVELATD